MSVSSEARSTIGELAKMVGVSVRALRHYEDVGQVLHRHGLSRRRRGERQSYRRYGSALSERHGSWPSVAAVAGVHLTAVLRPPA